MKAVVLAAALLLQVAVSDGPHAEPRHMRYQRDVTVAAAGPSCIALDSSVFAHVSSRALEDVRLFTGRGEEVPFALTESSPKADPPVEATVLNRGMQGRDVVFDLAMPRRPYSEVDLRLNAKNFIATARVTDAATHAVLGTFTLFDLTAQRLSRSTVLSLAESNFATLHVVLHVAMPAGAPMMLPPAAVEGAEVPASREAQTVYTPVMVNALQPTGIGQRASFSLPAHVPVERVAFALEPGFTGNFIREVKIQAFVAGKPRAEEELWGEISRVNVHPPAQLDTPEIREEHLAVPAVLSSNLHDAARVTVEVINGNDKPLPIRAVQLEMRERRMCFDAQAGARYTLRYGDPALHAAMFDYSRLFNTAAHASAAALGEEQVNPGFQARADARPYTERHPELIWIALFAVVAILGATAIGSVKHQKRMQ